MKELDPLTGKRLKPLSERALLRFILGIFLGAGFTSIIILIVSILSVSNKG